MRGRRRSRGRNRDGSMRWAWSRRGRYLRVRRDSCRRDCRVRRDSRRGYLRAGRSGRYRRVRWNGRRRNRCVGRNGRCRGRCIRRRDRRVRRRWRVRRGDGRGWRARGGVRGRQRGRGRQQPVPHQHNLRRPVERIVRNGQGGIARPVAVGAEGYRDHAGAMRLDRPA